MIGVFFCRFSFFNFLGPTRGLNQKSMDCTREFRSASASSAIHKNAFKWYQAFRWNFSWEKNEPLATPISLGLSWPRKLFATIWELLAIAIYFHYDHQTAHRYEIVHTTRKFNPEKWWLEYSFPFGMVSFQGLCSTSREYSKMNVEFGSGNT